MKRLQLILCAMLFLSSASIATTISGSVVYPGPGRPASFEKVYLRDSVFSSSSPAIIVDSTVTNSSGGFSFSTTIASGHGCGLQCNACGFPGYLSCNITSSSSSLLMTLGCSAIIVTDSVHNSSSHAPVWGQKVYIANATSSYTDSAFTDRPGVVSFRVPSWVAPGTLTVSTVACGLQSQSFSYSGTAVAPTLLICTSSPVVSGTLTNVSASAPIPYYKVVLTDSSATAALYQDSLYTNGSGAYSFLLPLSTPAGNMVVSVLACGARQSNSAAFTGSNLTLNLSSCATSSATISGILIDAVTSLPRSGQMVYFVDSISSSVIFRDSVLTSLSGSYSFTIPAATTSANLGLSTMSCGGMSSQYHYYSGTSIVVPNWSVSTGSYYTLSGTVYYRNKMPAAGVNVSLMQTGNPSPPAVVTAANGSYTISIPCSWSPGYISIEFQNAYCLSGWSGFPWSGSSVTGRVDTFFCPQISGVVTKQGGGAAANAKVYIVRISTDTSSIPLTKSLDAVDSAVTNSNGQYIFHGLSFSWSAPHGYSAMYLKAALQPSDPAYLNFLPTYYDSSLVWSGADTVVPNRWFYLDTNLNISLRGGSNPGGPGFIGGNVLLGANKMTGVGDPVPGRILLLTTAAGQAVAYTYSDASGSFSFSNLPLGNYFLFGDAGGKLNPYLAVSLSAGKTSVSNVVFEENSQHFEGHLNTLGVNGPGALGAVLLYPSPVTSSLNFSGLNNIKGDKSVVIRDLQGAVVLSTPLRNTSLELGTLPPGNYLLQLRSEEGVANFRFVKE